MEKHTHTHKPPSRHSYIWLKTRPIEFWSVKTLKLLGGFGPLMALLKPYMALLKPYMALLKPYKLRVLTRNQNPINQQGSWHETNPNNTLLKEKSLKIILQLFDPPKMCHWRTFVVKLPGVILLMMEEIRRSPVEVGSLSPIIYRVLYTIPSGFFWDSFHPQKHPKRHVCDTGKVENFLSMSPWDRRIKVAQALPRSISPRFLPTGWDETDDLNNHLWSMKYVGNMF